MHPRRGSGATNRPDQEGGLEPARELFARRRNDIVNRGCCPERFRKRPQAREALEDRNRIGAQLRSRQLRQSRLKQPCSLLRCHHECVGQTLHQAARGLPRSRRRRFERGVPFAAEPNSLGELLLRHALSQSRGETRVRAEMAHVGVDPVSEELEKSASSECGLTRTGSMSLLFISGVHRYVQVRGDRRRVRCARL